jgi:hypothetical protein
MCSIGFYEVFRQYEYMLIYQLDCWVFRDELEMWCDKGYDYIGAPFFVKWFVDRGIYVGNGGFSLRKISNIIEYLKRNNKSKLKQLATLLLFIARHDISTYLYHIIPSLDSCFPSKRESKYREKREQIQRKERHMQGQYTAALHRCKKLHFQ